MNFDELCDHLEFCIEHGGFDIGEDAQGGCSCEVCTFLRNYLIKETTKNDNDTSSSTE
jgi:hypothetical protein